MTRLTIMVAATAAALLTTGCDNRDPAPPPANQTAPAPSNSDATQSIMRPAVIAETKVEPEPDPVPRTPPMTTIGFPSGSTLDDAGRAALDELLASPMLSPDMLFVLSGHSDPEGSDSANLATSRRRAQAVAGYLENKGIAPARISIIALGERRPIVPSAHPDGSDDPEGRAKNRRVEVVVVLPPPAAPAEAESPSPDQALPAKD